MQKLVAVLYTNNELTERETKKTILFTLLQKIIKHLGIHLIKDIKTCTLKIIKH